MMLKHNNNFKSEGSSSYNFANRLRCASAHCEQAASCKGSFRANRTRRSLNKSLYSKITGWNLAMLAVCGVFSYLTFIPNQAFAAYDWEQRTLSDIDTMQDMNAKICENSEINESKQLEDTREPGKKYWVTKLKGDTAGTKEKGECWMTQNLDYDGGGTKTQNLAMWDGGTGIGHVNDSIAAYYDPGDYYYTTYSRGTSCSNATGLSACSEFKLTGDAHYHVGNYYSWSAAMNGETSAPEPVQGICPNNWQLPTGNNTKNKSFGGLMNAYNISGTENSNFYGDPMHFVYSGRLNSKQLTNAGGTGQYWSSTLYNDSSAYYFHFYLGVNSSDNVNRSDGMSVRCVAADVYPEKPPITDNDTANVAITISPVISIDVTKDANDMTVDFTKVATSTIIARVGSNQPYQVLLSTDKSDLTNPNTDKTIPMIPSEQTIVKGTSSWGIKKLSSPTDTEVNENTIYSPVGINGNKALFYTSDSAASEDLTFPVAIAVDSSLPSGQYSTQVTLTAVAM